MGEKRRFWMQPDLTGIPVVTTEPEAASRGSYRSVNIAQGTRANQLLTPGNSQLMLTCVRELWQSK